MQRYNYTHSEYTTMQSGRDDEFLWACDYARFLHHADMVLYRLDELDAAGKLEGNMLCVRALDAVQKSEFTNSFALVWFYIDVMDRMIEQLPVYEAPKPSKIARFFASLVA